MCHSAIKDQPPVHLPDNHEATMFSPVDTHLASAGKQIPCLGNCEPHGKMEVKIESLLNKEEVGEVAYKINETKEEKTKKAGNEILNITLTTCLF